MKRTFIIAALLICAGLNARETSQDTTKTKRQYPHQHAIEITTGCPSLVFLAEYPWLDRLIEASRNGQTIKEHYQPGLNVGYTFSWGKRWEVSALGNIHLTIYDVLQYPEIPSSGSKKEYDKNAEPSLADRSTMVWGSISADVRFKWIVRESFSMYSALGIGTAFAFPFPMPYIAPVGIKFGKGKVYGLAEVNISAANTFGMAGIGIRL